MWLASTIIECNFGGRAGLREMPDQNPRHLVILMHGIGTRAIWMNEVGAALKQAKFAVQHTSYGRYPIWRFVFRSKKVEQRAIERLTEDIAAAINIEPKPDRVSVIAHSFGTHAFSKILSGPNRADQGGAVADVPALLLPPKWHRIIFCGSVVRDDYRFQDVLAHFDGPLLNEVGCEDLWPRVAEKIGYGGVGAYGLNRPGVETRWHRELRHSDFLNEEFCRDNWVPFLQDGTILPGDKALLRPWLRMPKWPKRSWEKFWSFRKNVLATIALVLLVVVIAVGQAVDFAMTSAAQRSLCVKEANGTLDLPTRDAVRDVLIARKLVNEDFVLPADTRLIFVMFASMSRLEVLADLPADCKASHFKNAFEVGSFGYSPRTNNMSYVIEQFQRKLKASVSDKLAPMEVTGQLDEKTRQAIRFFRQQNGLPPSDEVDLDFMKKFDSIGFRPAVTTGQTK